MRAPVYNICMHKFACKIVTQKNIYIKKKNRAEILTYAALRMSNYVKNEQTGKFVVINI